MIISRKKFEQEIANARNEVLRQNEEEELFQRMKSTFAYMPKEGAWIQMNGHRYCNVCGHKDSPIMRNYCPNCGAKMRGANDE